MARTDRIDSERRSSLDRTVRDADLKHELEAPMKENSQLKGVVIRLSETIIRNVIDKK